MWVVTTILKGTDINYFSPYRMFYWDCVGLAHVKQEARLGNRTMGKKEGRMKDRVRRNNQRGKKEKGKIMSLWAKNVQGSIIIKNTKN